MKRCIKIYGERNTGTNYLSKLVAHNLDLRELPGSAPVYYRKVARILLSSESLTDLYFKCTFNSNLGWKHRSIPNLNEYSSIHMVAEQNVAFVSLTKNPYSWLLSLYRRPYHQHYSRTLTFEEFLKTPWQLVRRDGINTISGALSSPIELWNAKNSSYLRLREIGGLNLTSEYLLENPDKVISQLAHQFGTPLKTNNFVDHKDSTKEKGKDSNFYRDYYLKEKWKEKISEKAVSIINATIDQGLMSRFGYRVL